VTGWRLNRKVAASVASIFARASHSDIWVEFPDLPDATREEVERRLAAGYYDSS
jgi:hypothetical protein